VVREWCVRVRQGDVPISLPECYYLSEQRVIRVVVCAPMGWRTVKVLANRALLARTQLLVGFLLVRPDASLNCVIFVPGDKPWCMALPILLCLLAVAH